jgi:hypothetical protein
MAMNTSKVVVAGLAAGVVATIIGFVGSVCYWDHGSRRKRLPLRLRCRDAE